MSEVLQGWVECRDPAAHWVPSWRSDEWEPAIAVEAFMVDLDHLAARSPFASSLPSNFDGRLAPGRGLPADVSPLVAREAERWKMPWTCTYLTWAQLLPLRQREDLPDDWRLLLAMAAPLASACGEENVRLILWSYVSDYS